MTGPPAEVAAVRTAVRRALAKIGCTPGTPVLVACSGGADSLALAAAAAHLATGKRGGWPAYGAVVDHGLQEDSSARAQETATLLERLGLPTQVHRVEVVGAGGMEAAARRARYAALRAARPHPRSPVLLGHTLDDQAETVLLGLGRGSGARSLAGMATWNEPWLRPLLGVRRATTRAACVAAGLQAWDDPHNADPRFTRVRLRHEVLPLLEEVLAGGVAEALARTASNLAEDSAALDEVAADALAAAVATPAATATPAPQTTGASSVTPASSATPASATPARLATSTPAATRTPAATPTPATPTPATPTTAAMPATVSAPRTELDVAVLAGYPGAIRRRVLRAWLLDSGVREVSDARLRAADDLVGRWHGQGALALPGGLELARCEGRLRVRSSRRRD